MNPQALSLELVRQLIGQYSDAPADQVVPEAELAALNLDSLTVAEMLLVLEDEVGVRLGRRRSALPCRVADLARLVEPHMDGVLARAAA